MTPAGIEPAAFLFVSQHVNHCATAVSLETRVLRRIFGPKRDEVTREWRKLKNEKLNDLYSSPNTVRVIKSKRMRWAGHVARMGETRDVYRILVEKPGGKRPLERPTRRWENNIN